MEFYKLPANAEALLHEILQADNPVDMLCERFKGISHTEDDALRGILRQLREEGYININWASNVPYQVIINNSARVYDEQLPEYEKINLAQHSAYDVNKSINIEHGNTIKDSTIANKVVNTSENKKSFYDKHPVICGFLISLVAGIVLLFSFWSKIIEFIEGVF